MSQVTKVWYSEGQGYERSCGHGGFNIGSKPKYFIDDEILCEICANIETRIKAARVEALEEARRIIGETTQHPEIENPAVYILRIIGVIDKLIKAEK